MHFSNEDQRLVVEQDLVCILSGFLEDHFSVFIVIAVRVDLNPI